MKEITRVQALCTLTEAKSIARPGTFTINRPHKKCHNTNKKAFQ